jgi:putrescine transport system substrate-binding protein
VVLKPENLEKLKSCGVSFLDAPEEIFATVLNYLGKDPNSTKPMITPARRPICC